MKTITLTMNELEKLKVLERLKAKKIKQIDSSKAFGAGNHCTRGLKSMFSMIVATKNLLFN